MSGIKKPLSPKFFEEVWEDLEKRLPPEVPSAQREDMKNMFFLGGWVCFRVMVAIIGVSTDDEAPTAEDLTRMAWLNDELASFMEKLTEQYGNITIH